ncbi:MAG TPA: hypothetical protein VF544_25250 [Pyrinomonadaceae bacterium]|jgi:hypothetical protein
MREWTFYTIFFLLLLFIWPWLWRRFRQSSSGNDPSLAMGLVGWLVHAPSIMFAASLAKALSQRWFYTDAVGKELILAFILVALAFISIWRAANRSGYERGLEEGYKKAMVDQPPYR